MTSPVDSYHPAFQWQPEPQAAACIHELIAIVREGCDDIRRFEGQLSRHTGTRLINWIDHIALPSSGSWEPRLARTGFLPRHHAQYVVWEHPGGLFPQIVMHPNATWRLAVRVESVNEFLVCHNLRHGATIEGELLAPLRKARIAAHSGFEFWAVERHGYRGWEPVELTTDQTNAILDYDESFMQRQRSFADAAGGFEEARKLMRTAVADLGAGYAADLFFSAERLYWTSRNRAARFQMTRQDSLGLGWANHDHHTYRCGREHFARLIAVLEELKFTCRERFYAGREAGWGAQVLEQAESQVVVFADVDLSATEVSGDFAHAPLPPQPHFGTVGLWCLLHGEAFLEPGMHHLECRFDFNEAPPQFEQAGFRVMKPFTDLSYLKQAFTEAERWPVSPERLDAALVAGAITPQQAEKIRNDGALGSHLEILQRDDGYKGFNQTGINEIIRDTDPRQALSQYTQKDFGKEDVAKGI